MQNEESRHFALLPVAPIERSALVSVPLREGTKSFCNRDALGEPGTSDKVKKFYDYSCQP